MADNAFSYDAEANRPRQMQAGCVTTYIYDRDWRLIGQSTAPATPRAETPKDPVMEPLSGPVTTYVYDKHLGLTGIIHPDGTRVSYPFAVDAKAEENTNGAKAHDEENSGEENSGEENN